MTPDQFLDRLARQGPAAAYLFLGNEPFQRERARRALLEAALGAGDRESGFSHHDLDEETLASALDDARSLSLFAARRVIWISSAEAALPRGEAEAETPALAEYLREPPPGTVVVIECSRYGFEGDDKSKMERVRKFYSAIPAQVEFHPYSPEAARAAAQKMARAAGLQLGLAELAVLLEATSGDVARIAIEIEKLRLFAGERKVTEQDIATLVADAQSSTIFALVAALGRGDRRRALEILDTLSREGEYMPLALSFLATQFRMALAAREAGLRNASQIQAHFTRLGARMWPQRAREIEQTVQAFPKERLKGAIVKLFEADRALRDARPDDRLVMEELIFELTA
ncbi:MAG TPA: DNA polymerase III subunit delta [Bryobacteraceae bacterium]|jgi:DNA polymerase-3 subunit delta|nr:DNA polymerase III subunit delta [Bryobacteraceae bacterium]